MNPKTPNTAPDAPTAMGLSSQSGKTTWTIIPMMCETSSSDARNHDPCNRSTTLPSVNNAIMLNTKCIVEPCKKAGVTNRQISPFLIETQASPVVA